MPDEPRDTRTPRVRDAEPEGEVPARTPQDTRTGAARWRAEAPTRRRGRREAHRSGGYGRRPEPSFAIRVALDRACYGHTVLGPIPGGALAAPFAGWSGRILPGAS